MSESSSDAWTIFVAENSSHLNILEGLLSFDNFRGDTEHSSLPKDRHRVDMSGRGGHGVKPIVTQEQIQGAQPSLAYVKYSPA